MVRTNYLSAGGGASGAGGAGVSGASSDGAVVGVFGAPLDGGAVGLVTVVWVVAVFVLPQPVSNTATSAVTTNRV